MKNTLKIFATAGCLLASAVTANANLIVNGSFELPEINGWTVSSPVPGWTKDGDFPIEIGNGGLYGITNWDEKNVLELDSHGQGGANAIVSQSLNLDAGQYALSFLFAKRGNGPQTTGTSDFEVLWNDIALAAVISPTNTNMLLGVFSAIVNADQGQNKLTFKGRGSPDTHGALIDDVQLNRVPDATSTLALLGGVLGLMGLVARRRN